MSFFSVFGSMNEYALQNCRKQVVRLTLAMAAFGWGLALTFLFSSWEECMNDLVAMGSNSLQYDPFLDYWMRQIALTFVALGVLCSMVAYRPQKYAAMIRPIAWFHGMLGLVAAVSAWKNDLKMETYPTLLAELIFSFTICGVVLFFEKENVEPMGGSDITA